MTAPRILCNAPACAAAEWPREVWRDGVCWHCWMVLHPKEYVVD